MERPPPPPPRLGKPWTLDPVGVGATRFRNETTEKLLKHRLAIIRGNASEILAVARIAGVDVEAASPKGVDSAHETAAARGAAEVLARTFLHGRRDRRGSTS